MGADLLLASGGGSVVKFWDGFDLQPQCLPLAGGSDIAQVLWCRTHSLFSFRSFSVKRIYKGHNGCVTSARFNKNATHIASGSETGEIILNNFETGQMSSALLAPKVQAIRQLQYSYSTPSLLGAVSDDGTLNLWDTNSRKLLHHFSAVHTAPATGLSFFRNRNNLLVTAGLDGKICVFDMRDHKMTNCKNARHPLKSISGLEDIFAVGTKLGQILIYDVRKINKLLTSVESAHDSSVDTLDFVKVDFAAIQQRNTAKDLEKQLPVKSKHSPFSSLTPNSEVVTIGLGPRKNSPDGPLSPIQHGHLIESPNKTSEKGLSPHHKDDSPVSNLNSSVKSAERFNKDGSIHYSGCFSPLENQAASSIFSRSDLSSHLSQESLETSRPSGQDHLVTSIPTNVSRWLRLSEEMKDKDLVSDHQHNFATEPERFQFAPASPTGKQTLAAATVLNKSPGVDDSQGLSTGSRTVPSKGPSLPLLSQAHRQEMIGACALAVDINKAESLPSAGAGSASSDNSQGTNHCHPFNQPETFSLALMRSLVQDAMEEFTDQVHRDIQCFQVEMLHQFGVQRLEIQNLLHSYFVANENMQAEIFRLQEENKMLRKKF